MRLCSTGCGSKSSSAGLTGWGSVLPLSGDLKKSFEKSITDFRGHPVSYQDILEEAEKEKRKTNFMLTHEGKTIISTARLLCPSYGKCEINMIYTNPKYRGQGYAMRSVKN